MLSLGLMSGTSMDGIDAALIKTDGHTEVVELADTSLAYDDEFKILLKAAEIAVRKNKGDLMLAKQDYPEALISYLKNALAIPADLVMAKRESLAIYFHGQKNQVITFDDVVQRSMELHALVVKQLLQQANYSAEQVAVIGYHGQTLFHYPSAKITIQVGDGKQLAELTGITVVNDFRSRDVAAGGQGAPFAPLYHQALAMRDNRLPTVVVNCGGIANITVISAEMDALVGFDTGPGNGLVDRYVQQYTQGREQMDVNGGYGKKGQVNVDMLALLYEKAVVTEQGNFFMLPPPKSLDIGDLQLIPELASLSLADACRTLEAFTADTIVKSIDQIEGFIPTQWILAGGGWHNPVIKQELQERIEKKLGRCELMTADAAGWNGQALEAQVFAYLAVRSLLDLPISLPGTTRVPVPLSGGVVHFYQA
jgi:anhydro-N-acetylmuramic acid kinase